MVLLLYGPISVSVSSGHSVVSTLPESDASAVKLGMFIKYTSSLIVRAQRS